MTDQKDSDAAVPASVYYTVPLTHLDGSGAFVAPNGFVQARGP